MNKYRANKMSRPIKIAAASWTKEGRPGSAYPREKKPMAKKTYFISETGG